MPELFDKLNVLVRARINGLLSGTPGDVPRQSGGQSKDIRQVENEVVELRKHIDEALNAEETMQKRLDDLTVEVTDLDSQADQALVNGEDSAARGLVTQMQNKQRRITALTSELDDHRRATSDLIEQVNQLEALVSDAKRKSSELPAPAELAAPEQAAPSISIPLTRAAPTPAPAPGPSIPIAVKVQAVVEPTKPDAEAVKAQIQAEIDKAQVEDDLAARRKRLSRPD
jgi:chromosome segregation ATPase